MTCMNQSFCDHLIERKMSIITQLFTIPKIEQNYANIEFQTFDPTNLFNHWQWLNKKVPIILAWSFDCQNSNGHWLWSNKISQSLEMFAIPKIEQNCTKLYKHKISNIWFTKFIQSLGYDRIKYYNHWKWLRSLSLRFGWLEKIAIISLWLQNFIRSLAKR